MYQGKRAQNQGFLASSRCRIARWFRAGFQALLVVHRIDFPFKAPDNLFVGTSLDPFARIPVPVVHQKSPAGLESRHLLSVDNSFLGRYWSPAFSGLYQHRRSPLQQALPKPRQAGKNCQLFSSTSSVGLSPKIYRHGCSCIHGYKGIRLSRPVHFANP